MMSCGRAGTLPVLPTGESPDSRRACAAGGGNSASVTTSSKEPSTVAGVFCGFRLIGYERDDVPSMRIDYLLGVDSGNLALLPCSSQIA